MDPTSDPTAAPSAAPSAAPTACVDYESSFIVYNSNDGNDSISDINISPQIQESFAFSVNESVLFYNDTPTADAPVPYINALIGCNVSTETVCSVTCIGPASCLLANIIASSPFMKRILIRCNQKFSCKTMTLNYSQSLSPNVNEIAIECSALLACNEYMINVLSESTNSDANDTEFHVTIYCMETFSCKAMTINIRQYFASTMYINVYCVRENSCKQLAILNEHNADIHIQLWSFEYSESIEVQTTAAGYDLVDIRCGNEQDARYLRYDTSDLLNDEELLSKARKEYSARRLPCEGITITCTNIIDDQVYDQQCSMRYKLSDMVDVTQIIESKRDCFWINVNQLYTPQCVGSCGQNVTLYNYQMSVELEIILGINPDDKNDDLYESLKNDTVDEFLCKEHFGDINGTAQTLTSIDAIVNAALRFYEDTDVIHDIEKHSESRPLNGSINCDGFNMTNDVILINSTFSVQSITPNRDDVEVLFAPESIFYGEVHNLFSTYYGESLVPVLVTKDATFGSLSPSIDPTPGPTRSPMECPYNTFQYGTSDVRCYECKEDIGYECKGGLILNVAYGHWVAAHQTNGLFVTSPDMINTNYSLISLRCPAGQCCASNNGCDYFKAMNSNTLCAANRNLSSVTCSRCNDGYDELLGSSVCGTCERTNYMLISLLFILALVFTLFLFFVMARPNQLLSNISSMRLKEINWHNLLYYDQKDLVIVLISKICMYYYQGLSQI
eukprot:35323_1